jgi:hypothetical protein
MVEYSIMAFKNFSFSIGTGSPELMVYFSFGALIVAVMGYWTYKWAGVIIGILGVLFFYLYFTGFFSRIL